ncbi:metallophosphoesterase [Salipiger mucosus]|uniref:Metallophosphoesterase n=1 Tax=Salipiger mucosus DSM 16094 TaxID=1123237 RepID=S9QYW2_9RHOB|nr:metallophosphoesterase [Salipiger mucosus]EPX84787.1 metallophosphoesterase [Salipiger mucosus DSM 16094]
MTTKLAAIADLHLDLWAEAHLDPFEHLDPEIWKSDIVVLAGDISNNGAKKWHRMLPAVLDRVDPDRVHVIPGNHDYYGHHLDREDKLKAACDDLGCHFAQNAEIRIDDSRRVLACTLWTDYALGGRNLVYANMYDVKQRMNDFRKIRISRDGYRRIRPEDLLDLHKRQLSWLKGKLADGFIGETTVVTHHAPHPDAISTPDSDVSAAYASDLGEVIERYGPRRWLFGHTHTPANFRISGCDLANVSVGYPGQRDLEGQPPQFVFEV